MKDIEELGKKVMLYELMEKWLNVYSKYRVKDSTYNCYAAAIGWVKLGIKNQDIKQQCKQD